MSLLADITSGIDSVPPRLLVYGTEGVGKSTTIAGMPGVVFLPTEDGLHRVKAHKWPVATSYAEVIARLATLYNEDHDFSGLAIDTADWLAQLIEIHVCADAGVKTVADVGGGWGKGAQACLRHWREVVQWLAALHTGRHMAVVLIAHAHVETFQDPEGPAYDRYAPRLHKGAAALLTEWVDAVLFATTRKRHDTERTGYGRERAIAQPIGGGGGERILRTVGGPAYSAKNRYGLPVEIPLSWQAIADGIAAASA